MSIPNNVFIFLVLLIFCFVKNVIYKIFIDKLTVILKNAIYLTTQVCGFVNEGTPQEEVEVKMLKYKFFCKKIIF
jgi:hypothetical protein